MAFLAFEGDGLSRRAEARDQPKVLQTLWQSAKILPMWRGKPTMALPADNGRSLAFLSAGHPMAETAREGAVFLGEAENQAFFAFDLSSWQPEVDEEALNSFVDQTEQAHPDLPSDVVFADLRANMAVLSGLDAEIVATAKSILGWQQSHKFCAKCGHESQPAQAGWRRDCPACKAQHFPRTDPVVIMLVTHGNSVLLGRSPHWPERMYSLLAGFVEPGETLETAVQREVFEETGVHVEDVRYEASQPWPFVSSMMVGCVAEATGRALKIDPIEIEDAIWLTREELLEVFADRHQLIKPVRSGPIAGFLMENWLADRLTSRD